jgi:hypothetical protein
VPDASVTAAVAAAFAAADRGVKPGPPPLPFATDFGGISLVAPAADARPISRFLEKAADSYAADWFSPCVGMLFPGIPGRVRPGNRD